MTTYNFLTLHRDEIRHYYFTQLGQRPAFFDDRSEMWIVTRPADCRSLIASDKLRPVSYAEDYAALAARFGFDFSGLQFAFAHIPLCLHGGAHAHKRRAISEFLASRKTLLAARLPQLISRHFSALGREGRLELMHEVIEPFVHELTCLIADVDVDEARGCSRTSQIFDRLTGLGRRRAMEAEVSSLLSMLRRVAGHASEEEIGTRLALFILGRDPLAGTLGESLYRLLNANPGARLSDLDFPECPPETGVPFIERIVIAPIDLDGVPFGPGDRVRIFLQSFAYDDGGIGRTNFFGAGAHACLGRPLSLELWSGVGGFLATLPTRITVDALQPRVSDYIFTCPESLTVEISR